MQHIPEVDGVLLVKRAIESPTVPERGHHLRVGCGLLAEIGGHGIGGNRLRKDEADQGHTDQHWPEQEESPDDVALKCYRRSLAVSRIATMVSQQVSKSVGRLVGWSVTAKVNPTGVVYTIVMLEVRPAHHMAGLENLPETRERGQKSLADGPGGSQTRCSRLPDLCESQATSGGSESTAGKICPIRQRSSRDQDCVMANTAGARHLFRCQAQV